jgi:hypothetical protein
MTPEEVLAAIKRYEEVLGLTEALNIMTNEECSVEDLGPMPQIMLDTLEDAMKDGPV